MIVTIDSAADPRIADFTAIRERDLVGRQHGFIAEGEVVVRVLLERSRYRARAVLAADKLVDRIAPLVPDEVPLYVGSTALLSTIVGFPLHRGLLALGDRGAPPALPTLLDDARRLLVLEGITNHDNVGGIFRNAAAFGVDAVLLDEATCDPLYRKAIRVSSGAALSLPFAHGGTGEELIALLASNEMECWALTPSDGAILARTTPPARLALVLGAEGPGLPETLMQRCRRVSIPMAAGMDSLNVATAGAIALAHVMASRAG